MNLLHPSSGYNCPFIDSIKNVAECLCGSDTGWRTERYPANGETAPDRFSSLPVETIFSTTFEMATDVL